MEQLKIDQRFSLYQTALQIENLKGNPIDLNRVSEKFRIMVGEIEGHPEIEELYKALE